MLIDLRKLEHALAVARCGSFSLAASELGLAQPSLSRSIASLEALWDVRIFERGRTGVVVTPAGADLLRDAARLLAEARTLDHNMKLRGQAAAGSVAFGMAPLIGGLMMADILSFMACRAPDVKVTGTIRPMPELLADIRGERSELAVFSESDLPSAEGVQFELVMEVPMGFIVRAGHPLAGKAYCGWSEIAAYPLACSPYRRIPRLPREPNIICDNYNVMKEVMLRSDAVWLASPWIVRTELEEGRAVLLNLPADQRIKQSWLYMARVGNRTQSPAAALIAAKVRRLVRDLLSRAQSGE